MRMMLGPLGNGKPEENLFEEWEGGSFALNIPHQPGFVKAKIGENRRNCKIMLTILT